jgi:serine/threonine protein kinase
MITQHSDVTKLENTTNSLQGSKNKILSGNTPMVSKKRDIKEAVKNAEVQPKVAKNINIKSDLSVHVVTRWYRSPEIILLERDYGPPIDIWSVG